MLARYYQMDNDLEDISGHIVLSAKSTNSIMGDMPCMCELFFTKFRVVTSNAKMCFDLLKVNPNLKKLLFWLLLI